MRNRQSGMAMATVLLLMVLLVAILAVTSTMTLANIKQTADTQAGAQSITLMGGARKVGARVLSGKVGTVLGDSIVSMAQRGQIGNATTWVFAKGETGATPSPQKVSENMSALASAIQAGLNADGCYGPYDVGGNSTISLRITFTGNLPACDGIAADSVSLGSGRFIAGARNSVQTYAIPYVMVVRAVDGQGVRTSTVTGEYQFDVGNGSFSRYALLTDEHQKSATGATIYFTDRTNFGGPVHTNGNFAFSADSFFGGVVTSAGTKDRQTQGAYFYDSETRYRSVTRCVAWSWLGTCTRTQTYYESYEVPVTNFKTPAQLAEGDYGVTNPTFAGGTDWNAQEIPFPENANDQSAAASASGLYLNGASKLQFSIQTVNGKKYQYIAVTTSAGTVTYAFTEGGPLVTVVNGRPGSTPVQNAAGNPITAFNGVIYSNGPIDRLTGPNRTSWDGADAAPAIAEFAQLTVAGNNTIRITGDLQYERNPCASYLTSESKTMPSCESDPQVIRNVMGIYSNGGDVMIGGGYSDESYNAPKNVKIHATLMSTQEVKVENYAQVSCSRGTAYVLGGVITKRYGTFGTFNSNGCTSGYGRSFTYDTRMLNGLTPPLFPTTKLANLMSNQRVIQFSSNEQSRQ